MKRFYTLILITTAFLVGCASVPVVEKKPVKPLAIVEKKVPVKVEKTVFYPVKETSYYADGEVDEVTLYTYDNKKIHLLKKEVFDNDAVLQGMESYEYSGNMAIRSNWYAKNKELQGYHKFYYNKANELITDEFYDAKDNLQSKSEYEWVNSNKTVWKVYDGSGTLLSTTQYEYRNRLNVRINNSDPGGKHQDYFILDHDKGGHVIKETHFSNADKVLDATVYKYKNGYLSEKNILRGNGSVKVKIVYSNDKDGNPTEIIYMDSGNNVNERIEKEYNSRVETSYVTK